MGVSRHVTSWRHWRRWWFTKADIEKTGATIEVSSNDCLGVMVIEFRGWWMGSAVWVCSWECSSFELVGSRFLRVVNDQLDLHFTSVILREGKEERKKERKKERGVWLCYYWEGKFYRALLLESYLEIRLYGVTVARLEYPERYSADNAMVMRSRGRELSWSGGS